MNRNPRKPRKTHLKLTAHARQRLTERDLWPSLGHIARIAYHPGVPRYRGLSASSRPVESIEIDGVCIVVAGDPEQGVLTLLTVHSGNETGARARVRIASISQDLGKKVPA